MSSCHPWHVVCLSHVRVRLGHAHPMVKTGSVEIESLDLDSMLLKLRLIGQWLCLSPRVSEMKLTDFIWIDHVCGWIV